MTMLFDETQVQARLYVARLVCAAMLAFLLVGRGQLTAESGVNVHKDVASCNEDSSSHGNQKASSRKKEFSMSLSGAVGIEISPQIIASAFSKLCCIFKTSIKRR